MKNIIVVSFTDETQAVEAMHKLRNLDSYGDISIYEKIMIRKKADGEFEILKAESAEGWRTWTGMGIGSLLGLIAGPIGLAIGLYTGAAIGAIGDLGHYAFADDFITKTKNQLAPGTVSIIAEIDEDSYSIIEISLKSFDAQISRTDVDFEFDNYMNLQIESIESEIDLQRAALKRAMGVDKAKIQNRISELKERRRASIEEFEASAIATENRIEDKTKAAFDKVKSTIVEFSNSINQEVNEERKAWINSRIAKLEGELRGLRNRLKELTGE